MAPAIHTEQTFETAVEAALLDHGYLKTPSDSYDRAIAIDRTTLFEFFRSTQPKEIERLATIHGVKLEENVTDRLIREIEQRGILEVLRKGIKDRGVTLQLAFFRPESGLNPETQRLYDLNILTVTRQVRFSRTDERSVDVVLGLNGLPVATLELKNHLTGQTVEDGIKQYKFDRDGRPALFQFKKRALVHFAVDPDLVYMTTKLEGAATEFLPFNRGCNEGAGNPPNPSGYRTEYLYNEVLAKNSWMDILARFVHLQKKERIVEGKKIITESMIFPRYHQLDVVRKLAADARAIGAGKNYLIQHSAGSGKSNSIAWLAYRLSSLHDASDQRVFDSVIVITDRRVLDKQLQDTIYQFEHVSGVVEKIDQHSAQLADALKAGRNIIITTLQKFPFVIEKIDSLPYRKYAVIVDEAHSSQSGEAARQLREVLSASSLEEAEKLDAKLEEGDDAEDQMRKVMLSRGQQKNLSYFAFTATPKQKTLEVFGVRDVEGNPHAFHVYSMKQAIEEKFILDVLKNYTSYKAFYALTKKIEDDPNLSKDKANKALGRYLSLHPHNVAQKVSIIVEHFRSAIAKQLRGRAKAMVVTGSRLHAVRYYKEFQQYLKEKGYTDTGVLVAFSGAVRDDGKEVTEPQLNGFAERELPTKFNEEYDILIVAEKYQTGFDEPLLVSMYVDKALSGVKAVQTLSRLNRSYLGKEQTFVLDFVNDRQDILDSFAPFYKITETESSTDPNLLYDLKTRIEEKQIIWSSEIDNFCREFYSNKTDVKAQARLNSFLDPAVDRFRHMETEQEKDDFRNAVKSFVNLYGFLSQVMGFSDLDLEKLYTFSRFFLKKIRDTSGTGPLRLDDDVALQYYRLQKMSEGDIKLTDDDTIQLRPATEAGLRKPKEEKAPLSEIIQMINDRLGTEFTERDRLFFEAVHQDCTVDPLLIKQAQNNTLENFALGFDPKFEEFVIERMNQNQTLGEKLLGDQSLLAAVVAIQRKQVYEAIRSGAQTSRP